MVKDGKAREWILDSLRSHHEKEYGYRARWLEEFDGKQLKNKLDYLRKQGKKHLRTYVHPIIRRKEKGTGAAADSDDNQDRELTEDDLVAIIKESKWLPLRCFYEKFKEHPTMGFHNSVDTETVVVLGDPSQPQLSSPSPQPSTPTATASIPSSRTTSVASGTSARASTSACANPTTPLEVDDWNSSSECSSSSDDNDVLDGLAGAGKRNAPRRNHPAKKRAAVPARPAIEGAVPATPPPSSHRAQVDQNRQDRQDTLQRAIQETNSGADARLRLQEEMVSAENRRQREHEVAMAEHGGRHSAMLQREMSKTLAAIQEAQQQAQVNNL